MNYKTLCYDHRTPEAPEESPVRCRPFRVFASGFAHIPVDKKYPITQVSSHRKVKNVGKMALRGLLSPPSLHMRETDAQ
uniref:SFRICE_008039 n=1 Tax=Spodoptera frugiperda TaxID=7108 RepID=A0A2H1W2P1_SPOFR